MTVPLLSFLVFLPLLGALLVWLLPPRLARAVTAAAMAATLALAAAAVVAFDKGADGFQLVEKAPWISGLNIHYQVGIDGLSLFFLPATALLFLGALAAAWRTEAAPRLHLGLLLCLETATLGVFCALDSVLFFLFWELALVPLYGLLGGWGVVRERRSAAARYFLIMLAGGVPLLFGFLVLAASQPAPAFDLIALLGASLPRGTQYVVLFLFLAGFGVKVPLVPLHTWLPQLALAAPGAVTAVLVGLKLGAYGLIRVAMPLAPQAAQEMHWLLAGVGTLTVLYGAVGTLAQTNLRVMLAYFSISHVGLAVLGLASLNAQGVQGAVALVLNFSLATGGAFLLMEFLRQRTGSTDIRSLGGAARTMPLLASGFLLCGLSGVGVPGTSGFPGELLLVLAALKSHTGAGLGALFGLVVGAAGFLSLYRRAFLGPVTRPEVEQAADLRPRERAVLACLILLVVGFGLWPAAVLDVIGPAAEAWAARLSP
jgi:NADH-quinone oxidoreductase subunit M